MSKTIHFSRYEARKDIPRRERLYFWLKRRRIYQFYAWHRYGKKIDITHWTTLKLKKPEGDA